MDGCEKFLSSFGRIGGAVDEERIRYLGDAQRLELNPGEVLVVSVDRPVSIEIAERIRHDVQRACAQPDFVPDVIVLQPGMKLGVLACTTAAKS